MGAEVSDGFQGCGEDEGVDCESFEAGLEGAANGGIVIDDEDLWLSVRGELDGECGALLGCAGEVELSLMLLDDAESGGEAESAVRSWWFGGEEGVEDPFLGLFIHTGTGVLDV